ncbi:hypothetical protein [Paenibacillus tianjinensis]|uniref:Uncharacterized protein n=1 Tax=Paenibacillus tianjinensis TaxID=2810347 RepID=A0ABX7L975_9BACL|nr:hypothetical protein [Paenibacillus tianjinensis]QSF43258.1 hypothetical protein JRJ22_18500 [Paenibacillus tianjinensis]
MNNNVLDFKNGSKKKKNKEALNTKFYRISENEINQAANQVNDVLKDYKELSEDYKQLFGKYKDLAEKYNNLGERFLKENDDAENYFEMFNILCDSIVLSGIGDSVVADIYNTMQLWEEEGEFAEYEKDSYIKVIKEIQDFSEMLKEYKC